MIERHFNVPFVAALALREKQIQQNYRPLIAVHKWFARRPGALFRALILSELSGRPVNENAKSSCCAAIRPQRSSKGQSSTRSSPTRPAFVTFN